jgi:hypothetical protein
VVVVEVVAGGGFGNLEFEMEDVGGFSVVFIRRDPTASFGLRDRLVVGDPVWFWWDPVPVSCRGRTGPTVTGWQQSRGPSLHGERMGSTTDGWGPRTSSLSVACHLAWSAVSWWDLWMGT